MGGAGMLLAAFGDRNSPLTHRTGPAARGFVEKAD